MADCTKTSIGETASTYERAGSLQSVLDTAAENIILRDASGVSDNAGLIGWAHIGMSTQDYVATKVRELYLADADRNVSLKMVSAGKPGATADTWAASGSSVWSTFLAGRVSTEGLTTAQVQIFTVLMTQAYPLTKGAMTEAQVRAIVSNIKSKYANTRIVYLMSNMYTGYADDEALSDTDRYRAPEPYVYNDSVLMASLAVMNDLAATVDFVDVWCNGTTANARSQKIGSSLTAASDPLSWACSDVQSDGVHPSTAGTLKVATTLLERYRIMPELAGVAFEAVPPITPAPPRRGLIVVGV